MPNVYEIVTEQITKRLAQGEIPWRKPWVSSFPVSLRSQKPYRGINVLLLASQGYASPYWLTYNQATALGGHVRRGEESTVITFWKRSQYTRENKDTGDPETCNGFILRYYRVFNLCQTDGIAQKLGLSVSGSTAHVPDLDACEALIRGYRSCPKITASNSAWYRPLTDTVGIPDRSTFHSSEFYYSVLFHELAHSTGHASRLDRWNGQPDQTHFASESYSKEELVAEFSAAFLCGLSGISPATLENSTAYIQGWLRRLRNDPKLLVSAAGAAQKACDLITGRTWSEETSAETTAETTEAIAA